MARVQVVIPTRNRPSLLAEAVASALAQGPEVDRVFVVNDGEPIPEFVLPSDPRVRVIPNLGSGGAPGARNTGLAEVRTPWVVFLDDDDQLDETWVNTLLTAAERHGDQDVVLLASGFRIRGADGSLRERRPSVGHMDTANLLVANTVGPTSFSLCRVEAVKAIGGFDEGLAAAQDWDLWIRLSERGTLIGIPEILGTYRIHAGEQISASCVTVRYVRHLPFYRKRDRHPRASEVRKEWASETYWWGVLLAWTGDVRGAVAAFERALRYRPGHFKSRAMLCWVQTPFRKIVLRAIYGTRKDRIWFEDRREPLPLR